MPVVVAGILDTRIEIAERGGCDAIDGQRLHAGRCIAAPGNQASVHLSDQRQIANVKSIVKTGSGGDASPVDIKTKDLQPSSASGDSWSNHLVRVQTVQVKAYVDQANNDWFWISDDGNACTGTSPPCTQVGDFFYDGLKDDGKPATSVGTNYSQVIGIVNAYQKTYTLDVRTDADLIP